MSLRPSPIPLVYNMANLIGVDPSMHSFVYYFVIDLAILQKYYVLTLEAVGLQIYKMINLGSNVIVYKLKHCVLHFEVNMMTF